MWPAPTGHSRAPGSLTLRLHFAHHPCHSLHIYNHISIVMSIAFACPSIAHRAPIYTLLPSPPETVSRPAPHRCANSASSLPTSLSGPFGETSGAPENGSSCSSSSAALAFGM